MNGIKNWSWYTPLNGLNLSKKRRRRRNKMEEGEERTGTEDDMGEAYRMKIEQRKETKK